MNAPIFIRIYKEESELEVWKLKDGRFQHFRTYPVCAWSGGLGPKLRVGDKQTPEGFYTVSHGQMNPNSHYHLAFNIGFPNAYDSANGRTGSAVMVHGDCKSAGCFAMTDARIEEIYALARKAFDGGQSYFHVHIMPFRMTAANLASHRDSPWYPFWLRLKEGYELIRSHGQAAHREGLREAVHGECQFPQPGGGPKPGRRLPRLRQDRSRKASGHRWRARQDAGQPEQARRAMECGAGCVERSGCARKRTSLRGGGG